MLIYSFLVHSTSVMTRKARFTLAFRDGKCCPLETHPEVSVPNPKPTLTSLASHGFPYMLNRKVNMNVDVPTCMSYIHPTTFTNVQTLPTSHVWWVWVEHSFWVDKCRDLKTFNLHMCYRPFKIPPGRTNLCSEHWDYRSAKVKNGCPPCKSQDL